jgi:twinkle protein
MPSERLAATYISSLLDEKDESEALKYLTNVRGLIKATLRKYGVGRGTYNFPGPSNRFVPAECVTFPWILPASQVIEHEELRGASLVLPESQQYVTRRIKARALEHKAWQRLDPPGGGWGLFGYHTIPEDATEIVVTEGEYDAMAGTIRLTCNELTYLQSPGLTFSHSLFSIYSWYI